jgi:hypothetical protein
LQKLPRGLFSPKFGHLMGISCLNKSMNNFSTVHAIFAEISSIGAACRKKLKSLNEMSKNSFHGALF